MEARELPQPQFQAFGLVLRIRHPSMDPEDISRRLKLTAEHCFKAGDPRKPSGAAAQAGPRTAAAAGSSLHTETYWLATLDPALWQVQSPFPEPRSTESMNQFAMTVLGLALSQCTGHFLGPHAEFFGRIQAEGGEARLLVEINTSIVDAFTLTPELGRQIGKLGIPIDFEFAQA